MTSDSPDEIARRIAGLSQKETTGIDGKSPGKSESEDAIARRIAGVRDLHTLHPDELLTRNEAATYLGIAEATLAIWASNGTQTLPLVKIGRLVRYQKSDLDAYIARRKK